MTVKKKRRLKKRKGPRRHIRKSLIIGLVVCILAVTGLIKIPQIITDSKLRKLGYSETAIVQIEKQKLTDLILKNDYYSDYLAQCIEDGSLQKQYIELYTVVDTDRGLTSDDLLLYNRLLDLGYEQDQLDNLFKNLSFWEITPLLVFDYQYQEQPYIDDCKANRSKNSTSSFTLDGDYLTKFKNLPIAQSTDGPLLINMHNALDAAYAPDDLTSITTEYAADGMQLRKEAADAFVAMGVAALKNGTPFFASTSYLSYSDQESMYKRIVSAVGTNSADDYVERPGYSEHQTGNAVNISATYDDNSNITATTVYAWLQVNAAKYGFLLRYPSSKQIITGHIDEPTHLLYLGKALAEKINDSKLTYDEYYCLYLADWYEESNVPASSIIDATGANQEVTTQTAN